MEPRWEISHFTRKHNTVVSLLAAKSLLVLCAHALVAGFVLRRGHRKQTWTALRRLSSSTYRVLHNKCVKVLKFAGPREIEAYHVLRGAQGIIKTRIWKMPSYSVKSQRMLLMPWMVCLTSLRQNVSANTLIQLARSAARALRTIHSLGVIHNDVKPGNMFVCNNRRSVCFADFGSAHTPRIPSGDDFQGTYMFCLDPSRVSRRRDLQSLCLTFLWLVQPWQTEKDRPCWSSIQQHTIVAETLKAYNQYK